MKELDKYAYEMEALVEAVVNTCRGEPITHTEWYAKSVAIYIKSFYRDVSYLPMIERAEVEQQLRCMWVEFVKAYKESKPDCHIKQYLLRMSVWGLRDWLMRESCTLRALPQEIHWKDSDYFSMSLFVLGPHEKGAFVDLTLFEKYLIALRYIDKKTILEIAKILQQERHTVSRKLNSAVDKIRRKLNV